MARTCKVIGTVLAAIGVAVAVAFVIVMTRDDAYRRAALAYTRNAGNAMYELEFRGAQVRRGFESIGVVAGILLALGLGYKNIPKGGGGLQKALNVGAIGSLLAIMNTASEVGYGNVIAALPGFKSISAFLLGIKVGVTPLVSEAVSVTTLAGITGSASGGMSIALDLMSKNWLAWANSVGLSPEVLHRIASMASGGCDTMPHNGAVITLLAVCGLTHRQSYADIGMMTLIKTSMVFVMILFYALTGLY